MKNAFYFTIKSVFVLKIFTFLSWLFDYVEKRLDEGIRVNFKFYYVTTWETSNGDTYCAQYHSKKK